jgi:hypothetical protein
VLCQFVLKAWGKVTVESVVKSFKKCGISNAMDGTEDDELYDDAGDDETEPADTLVPIGLQDADWDPYDDCLNDEAQDLVEELLESGCEDSVSECDL